ncbi:MAG: tRNA (adenosine(37)-N6)-threonylcarbamoyltransferase complex ATPase subunit type 1 TsaE [Ignavibacteriae bacterium]|nr:tRNA (adenosine(37)-N6)-threonylcarbamoyltransferase complex ATPase subunit type 1 TsaE [Ignavibacteriota bacterium]
MTQRRTMTRSEDETRALARAFAAELRRGDVVALSGELGAGKTHFVKGMCEAFGVHEPVTSPTFVILNRYGGKDSTGNELLLYHLDLYRVKSLEEIYDIGYEEIFYSNGIAFVEWAEFLGELLPPRRYDVRLSFGEQEHERTIEIHSVEDKRDDASSVSRRKARA